MGVSTGGRSASAGQFAARFCALHQSANVRVIVPLLGGGFGSKCDFHYEAHVAVLAKATKRPVRLVFTRKEEFFAPDHRREGMTIELETGVRKDGTLVARRGTLVLDGGAYFIAAADGRSRHCLRFRGHGA